jgi:hypothetical protein
LNTDVRDRIFDRFLDRLPAQPAQVAAASQRPRFWGAN